MSPPLHRARVALRALRHMTSRTTTEDAAERGENVLDLDESGPWTPGLTGHTGLNGSGSRRESMMDPLLPGAVPRNDAQRANSLPDTSARDAPGPHLRRASTMGSWRRASAGGALPAVVGRMGSAMHIPSLRPLSAVDAAEDSLPEPQAAPGLLAPLTDARAIGRMVTGSLMNILLVMVPLGWAAKLFGWSALAIFVLNFLALIPLALILGEVTEDLALRFGETIGGLLNATFGNVVELILSLAALSKGLFSVVRLSLIGSILSNLLLVLGFCFLCGGTRYKEQSFNLMVNKACCSLLFMACIALDIPTAASVLYPAAQFPPESLQRLSHGTAILLALVYLCYLLFSLKTHNAGFATEAEGDPPALSLLGALGTLGAITILVAIGSELLTGALEEVAESTGLGEAFLGLIVLPCAGNACEHITAVYVALKNKMDLAVGVALGSSIQIAVFVLPIVVLTGWAMGQPMTLSFDPFAAIVLTLSVIHTFFVSSDGNSNWLMGVQLISAYILIALLYLCLQGSAPA